MRRAVPAFGAYDIGDSIADVMNAMYRQAQFLERVGGFLKSMGDLAPPCAALPYVEERDRMIELAGSLKRVLPPVSDTQIREAVVTATDALEKRLKATPVITQAWIDAPPQWQAGAYERQTRVPTRALGAIPDWAASRTSWDDVRDIAEGLANVASITWLITIGPPGAVIAGVLFADRGGGWSDMVDRYFAQKPVDLAGELKSVVNAALAEAVRFESNFKPSIYQQVLGAWLIVTNSADRDVTKAAMAAMNPYTLPTMPDGWDGSFSHMRESTSTESASWLIALLLGSVLGLGIAVMSTE